MILDLTTIKTEIKQPLPVKIQKEKRTKHVKIEIVTFERLENDDASLLYLKTYSKTHEVYR